MVSLLIFGFIGIFIVQNIQSAVRSHKNFKPKMEKSFKKRTVFLLIRRDLNQAFHFRDFYLTEYNKAVLDFKRKYKRQIEKREVEFPLKPKTIKQDTYFKGSSREFSFTSFNSLRHFSQSASYPVYVSYSLESCKNKKGEVTECLIRKEWLLEKEEPSSGVHSETLIRGVESMEFFYLSETGDEKTPEWSSLEGAYKNQFPSALEVVFETQDKEKRRWVISLHFPNNKKSS